MVGGQLHVPPEVTEDGAVLVLVSSLDTDVAMRNAQVPVLAQRHLVVRLDPRGQGRSSSPPLEPCADLQAAMACRWLLRWNEWNSAISAIS